MRLPPQSTSRRVYRAVYVRFEMRQTRLNYPPGWTRKQAGFTALTNNLGASGTPSGIYALPFGEPAQPGQRINSRLVANRSRRSPHVLWPVAPFTPKKRSWRLSGGRCYVFALFDLSGKTGSFVGVMKCGSLKRAFTDSAHTRRFRHLSNV